MKRHYTACPDCHARMKRTGVKEKVREDVNGRPLYNREMECPSCRVSWIYDESGNVIRRGHLNWTKKE